MKDDLISRAEALYMLGEEPVVLDDSEYAIGALEQWRYDFAVINELPSRPEPRRKKGRWSGACCSVCGVSRYNFIKILHTDSGYRGTWKYCPNCGADMRETWR